ncbi:MAG: DUF6326 family protein [Bacteroidota bacterium]
MNQEKLAPQTLISTLWIAILLTLFLRDLHEFLNPSFLEQLMEIQLSEANILLFGMFGQVPILMVVLSRILNNSVNKWTNSFAALITALGILYTLPDGQLDDYFFALVNAIGLVAVLVIVWGLPAIKKTTSENTTPFILGR